MASHSASPQPRCASPIAASARIGQEVKKPRNLAVEQIYVCGKPPACRGVTGHRTGTDRHDARVADVMRYFDRLEFRIEQILGADHDQRLRLNCAQRLYRVAV